MNDYEGVEHRISDFHGKKTILFFWSSTCSTCITKLPAIKKFAADRHEMNLVAIDVYSDQKRIRELIGEDDHAVIFLHDDTDLVQRYNLSVTPTFYILDEEGVVIRKTSDFNQVLQLE